MTDSKPTIESYPPVDATDNALLEQAAQWMARLWADDVSEQDRQACQQWRNDHPQHELAWQLMLRVSAKFNELPVNAVNSQVLDDGKSFSMTRRRLLQLAGAVSLTSLTTYYGFSHQGDWRGALAAYSTEVGEIRTVVLADGTEISLNTDTALDVNFTGQLRNIVLYRGEVLITTGHETPRRRFVVNTEFGELTALGTKFSVRQYEKHSQLAVYEGAVQAQPLFGRQGVTLESGEKVTFDSARVSRTLMLSKQTNRWRDGVLVAERMLVGDLISELARYRRGFLSCDSKAASLQVSGVFSVEDTDRALQSLVSSLPIEVVYRTRYWVRVVAMY